MKWLGWIVAVFLGLLVTVVTQVNQKKSAVLREQLNRELLRKESDAEQLLRTAEEGIPALRTRLQAEEAKAAEFRARHETQEAQKLELEEQVAALEARIETLSTKKEDLQEAQRKNAEEVRQLQGRIARLEADLGKLEELLRSVSEAEVGAR
jgi:chromosome segregation ATPase